MGFVVLPALIPDIPAVYDVYFAAFARDAVTRAMFPNVSEEDLTSVRSEFRKQHTEHVRRYWHHSSTQYTVKCVDSSSGAVVGMGLWDVYVTPSDYKPTTLEWLAGDERKRAEALVKPFGAVRKKLWANERYVYCHLTAVHPNYQRRGIGKMLMEVGMRIAEQANLPIYTEASHAAIGLYERLGFKRLKQSIIHQASILWAGDIKGDGKDYEVPLVV